jgi:hypothetical protein
MVLCVGVASRLKPQWSPETQYFKEQKTTAEIRHLNGGNKFRKNNIILPHPFPPIGKYVRVSLGTREDMPEFWRVWDLLPSQKMSM